MCIRLGDRPAGRAVVSRLRGQKRGICHWCHQPCHPARNWHKDCVKSYLAGKGQVRHAGTPTRLISGHVCAGCGNDMSDQPITRQHTRRGARMAGAVLGEVDHRYPLWKAAIDQRAGRRGWWKAWTLGNLQLLCRGCHLRKCRQEAEERAKIKRSQRRTAKNAKNATRRI